MTRHRGACTTAIFFFYHLTELLYGHLATTYLKKCADNSAHHIAKKTVGLNDKTPFMVTYLFPSGLHDVAIVGCHIGMQFTKTCKINIIE